MSARWFILGRAEPGAVGGVDGPGRHSLVPSVITTFRRSACRPVLLGGYVETEDDVVAAFGLPQTGRDLGPALSGQGFG